jgi:hypothetical protein
MPCHGVMLKSWHAAKHPAGRQRAGGGGGGFSKQSVSQGTGIRTAQAKFIRGSYHHYDSQCGPIPCPLRCKVAIQDRYGLYQGLLNLHPKGVPTAIASRGAGSKRHSLMENLPPHELKITGIKQSLQAPSHGTVHAETHTKQALLAPIIEGH